MADFQFEVPKVEPVQQKETFIAAHEILPQSTDRLQNRNDGRAFFGEAYAPLDSVNMQGWVHQPREAGLPLHSFVERYTPTVDGEQRVSMFFNGLPPIADKDTAAALRQILTDQKIDDKNAPYVIKDFDKIRGALTQGPEIPNEFNKQAAYTRTIDNKRIIFVQGNYTHSDASALIAYIDADPKHPGQMFVTASYVASPELFNKYLPQAKRAFETMRFNNKTQEDAE